MQKLLLLLIPVLIFTSCRSTRNISTAVTKKDTATVKVLLPEDPENDTVRMARNLVEEIRKNTIDYTTFSAKVNVDYKGADGKGYNVNANIRMYRDSAIWISANAVLGIEALRVLITRDSVKFLDKINKTYTERSLSYLQEITELPLDLKTFQDLIIGNPLFLDSAVSFFAAGNGILTLMTTGTYFKNLLTVREADHALLRSKLDDIDATRSRTAELTYTEYETKKNVLFANKRSVSVAYKNRLDVKLDFRQYDFNVDVSFPFSIPRNFKTE